MIKVEHFEVVMYGVAHQEPALENVRHLGLHRLKVGRPPKVLWPDTADLGPVVGDSLRVGHKGVVQLVTKVVDYAYTS